MMAGRSPLRARLDAGVVEGDTTPGREATGDDEQDSGLQRLLARRPADRPGAGADGAPLSDQWIRRTVGASASPMGSQASSVMSVHVQ
jgi:hypothetical protein